MATDNNILFLYNQKAIVYNGTTFESGDFKDSKSYFTTAIIPLKYLSIFSYKIANTTNDDEIAMQTEIKMYSEGGLDANKEYIVDYIKYDIGSEYLIEAFALSKEYFDEYFAEYTQNVVAIDMVFPRFLAYQSLYDEKLEKKSNDLILYISETESFATLYQNGVYIGYKTLSSLNEISKRVGLEVVKLKEYLQTKGLVQENYELDEIHILDSVQSILYKDLEKIMYSMNQKRSLFGFNELNKVFIDFDGHNIVGLDHFFVQYGYDALKVNKFEFEEDDQYGNISIYTNYLYKYYASKDENSERYQHLNFSFLERKKPLIQYMLLKYGLLLTVSMIACLLVYIYFEFLLSEQQNKIHQQQSILKKEKSKSSKFEKKVAILNKEYQAETKKEKKLADSIFVYENTLSAIPLIQHSKIKREKFMNDVVEALAKYKLNTLYLKQYDDKSMDVMLISNSRNRTNITRFINILLKKNYHSVTTQKIYLDKTLYKSLVRIKL